MLNRIMQRFAIWFGSPQGVAQTFLLTTFVGIAEQVWPGLDPQHFFYMYLMTYYSTVTQTVLAYASSLSTERSEQTLKRIEQLEQDQHQMMTNQTDMMRLLLAMGKRTHEGIEEIVANLEEEADEKIKVD